MRLQKGNMKLPKETLIWNLPAIKTCPNSTEACRKHCYALKAEKMYPNVLPFRELNLKLSKEKDFAEMIESELATSNFEQIRISESGDFYNQEYLNKWIDIAKKIPSKIVYAYTKSIHLDFSKKPRNMIIIYSDDERKVTIKELKKKGFNGRATVDNKALKNETLCPGSCKECSYCFSEDKVFKRVVFKKH
jgi:hypothetical protein